MRPKNLYRYISLENFVELLVLNEEIYTLPSKWKDPYEGCALQFINQEGNRKRLIEALAKQYQYNDNFINAIVDNYAKAEAVSYCSYAQCWTYKEESDAMWNRFGNSNHAIQIASNTNRIRNILQSQKNPCKIDKIKYDIKSNDDFIRFFQNGSDLQDQFFHKRPAFSDEGEYRVVITRDYYVNLFYRNLNNYRHELINQYKEGKEITVESIIKTVNDVNKKFSIQTETTLKVKINDVSTYITGVRVHPDAESWYVDLIKKMCLKYKIKFNGKSSLYEKL